MAENSFFSVSSFKFQGNFRVAVRSKSVDVPLTWEDFVAYSTQHRCGGFFFGCASFGAMNRWAFWQGNQIRGSGAACHHDDFNSALCGRFDCGGAAWRGGAKILTHVQAPLEKCIHVDAVSTVETSILCWKGRIWKALISRKKTAFCQAQRWWWRECWSRLGHQRGTTIISITTPNMMNSTIHIWMGMKASIRSFLAFLRLNHELLKTQLGFPAKKRSSIDCGRKIDSDLGWCFDLVVSTRPLCKPLYSKFHIGWGWRMRSKFRELRCVCNFLQSTGTLLKEMSSWGFRNMHFQNGSITMRRPGG